MSQTQTQQDAASGELSQEEQNILKEFRTKKIAIETQKKYWQNVMSVPQFEVLTADELLTDIIEYHKEEGISFDIDDDNREAIKLLMQYFTNDPEFEKEDRSLKKGNLIYGPVGCGKSHLMKVIAAANQRQCFRIFECTDIVSDFGIKDVGGELFLKKFFQDHPVMSRDMYGRSTVGFLFDDFGNEKDGNYMGNITNVMERILEVRYRSRVSLVTHLISNLTTVQIRERYGARLYDRLKEGYNIIEFPATAKSRRK